MAVIKCMNCGQEHTQKDLNFKTIDCVLEGKKVQLVYYKCKNCNKPHLISILDYWGKKLQDRYIASVDSLAEYQRTHSVDKTAKGLQKQAAVEKNKAEALAYQEEILNKYINLIPEEIFV